MYIKFNDKDTTILNTNNIRSVFSKREFSELIYLYFICISYENGEKYSLIYHEKEERDKIARARSRSSCVVIFILNLSPIT